MYSKLRDFRKRQAGKEYENYVAMTLQQEGWNVYENGRYGMRDHGIDLIASKDGVRRYIQCKGWKRTKFIHDDVVSQLYGSVADREGTDNLKGVEIYLYSPAQLDEYASGESLRLNIHFIRLDFPKWHQKYRQYRHHRKYRSKQVFI